ncbi:hypothetical protein V8C26DRAFT_39732 [Trichoderma gracile]
MAGSSRLYDAVHRRLLCRDSMRTGYVLVSEEREEEESGSEYSGSTCCGCSCCSCSSCCSSEGSSDGSESGGSSESEDDGDEEEFWSDCESCWRRRRRRRRRGCGCGCGCGCGRRGGEVSFFGYPFFCLFILEGVDG